MAQHTASRQICYQRIIKGKTLYLLGWHVERRALLHLLHVFLLAGFSRRPHLWSLFLIALYPVSLPLLFPPHPLLLTLALPLSFSLSLSSLPFPVVPLPLPVPVALPRVPLTFAFLSARIKSVLLTIELIFFVFIKHENTMQ